MRLFLRFLRALAVLAGRSQAARGLYYVTATALLGVMAGRVAKLAIGDVAIVYVESAPGAAGYTDQGVFKLAHYIRSVDCDANESNCDLYPAFQTVMSACAALRTRQGLDTRIGCTFDVPEGRHRLSQTVNFCRYHTIQGSGTWTAPAVWLVADATAFIGRGSDWCTSRGLGAGGFISIRGVGISTSSAAQNQTPLWALCDDGNPATPCGIFGVLLETGGKLEDMFIAGFTQGVRIVGSIGLGSNANLWHMARVYTSETYDTGIFLHGNDANAGVSLQVNVNAACSRGDVWKNKSIGDPNYYTAAQLKCAGLWDKSFLGNTHLAAHTDAARDTVSDQYYPNYKFESANTCVGCYAEGGTVDSVSEMTQSDMAIGGSAAWTADTLGPSFGYHQVGSFANGIVYRNKIDDNKRAVLRIGVGAREIFRVEMLNSSDALQGQEWKMIYDTTAKGWAMGFNSYNLGWQTESGGTYGTIGQLKLNCSLAPNVTGCTP